MGNPQEITPFIYDWLEQLMDNLLSITEIMQHKHVLLGIKCKQGNQYLGLDHYVIR